MFDWFILRMFGCLAASADTATRAALAGSRRACSSGSSKAAPLVAMHADAICVTNVNNDECER